MRMVARWSAGSSREMRDNDHERTLRLMPIPHAAPWRDATKRCVLDENHLAKRLLVPTPSR